MEDTLYLVCLRMKHLFGLKYERRKIRELFLLNMGNRYNLANQP